MRSPFGTEGVGGEVGRGSGRAGRKMGQLDDSGDRWCISRSDWRPVRMGGTGYVLQGFFALRRAPRRTRRRNGHAVGGEAAGRAGGRKKEVDQARSVVSGNQGARGMRVVRTATGETRERAR